MPKKGKSKKAPEASAPVFNASALNGAEVASAGDSEEECADLSAKMLSTSVGDFNPVFGMDPRALLTMKATRNKTVHITEFVPDHIKKKRFPKAFRLNTTEGGEACLLYPEAPVTYEGITIDVWGAANMRLLNRLLESGQLARTDVEFYLAYTAHIFDLAERYLWGSILMLDMQYRELQAEHGFPWGTFAAQLELKTLVPKPTATAGAAYTPMAEECRMFKARGSCTFGSSCKYRHAQHTNVRHPGHGPDASLGAASSKN